MRFGTDRCFRAIKAMLSGLSLSLTICCGIGLMRTLMIPYDEIVPGGHSRAPALTQIFMSLPHHAVSANPAILLLLTGGAWLGWNTKEESLALVNRCAVAFVVTGIYACAFAQWCLCGVIHWESSETHWVEYLWLIPSAIPLIIALAKQRRSSREE